MSFQKVIGGGSLVLALSGHAAWAEVTPQDVWADWTRYMEAYGYRVSATESSSGSRLELSDVELSIVLPEDEVEGDVSIAMGDIALVDNGNGTVSVDIPTEMPILIRFADGDESGEAKLNYTTEGYEMIVSGDPEKLVYEYKAAKAGLALVELTEGEQTLDIGMASLTVSDIAGRSQSEQGDLNRTTQEMTSGPVRYALDFTDVEGGDRFVWEGESASMTLSTQAAVPPSADWTDVEALLGNGFAVEGAFGFGPGNSSFSVTEDAKMVKGSSNSEGGSLSMNMNEDVLEYRGRFNQVAMQLAGGDLPFPVAIDAAETGFDLGLPLRESETPQDFSLGFLLGDFTVSDFVWDLFDPERKLSRDPATLALGLSGTATMRQSLLSEENMEGDEVPGDVNSLSLDDFRLSVAGAEMTGEGAVEFDHSDTTSYDGMPKPVGDVTMSLKGGNSLLDALVEIGLIPQDQALGMRMMMGMFAVAGDGPDDLRSRIEFTDEGQVLANGQRIK
ncbi:DUF2125 domain-containing protein [Roseovarius sp. C7]|uniref:DUF2125 domain-containing protein n=1 Tax=Roseovarius sp. C7 TaxID=3398643 RepID=UPI0039F6BE0A